MNTNRNLNGVKNPLSDRAHTMVVERIEERFSHAMFIPSAPVVELVAGEHGTEECRCDVCINKMLDGILERSEASLKTITESVDAQTA